MSQSAPDPLREGLEPAHRNDRCEADRQDGVHDRADPRVAEPDRRALRRRRGRLRRRHVEALQRGLRADPVREARAVLLEPVRQRPGRRRAARSTGVQLHRQQGAALAVQRWVPAATQRADAAVVLRHRRRGSQLPGERRTQHALSWRFPPGSPLRQPEPGAPKFDTQDSRDVHDYVLALLRDWDGMQIHQVVHHNYRRYRYFGLSALGESPTDKRLVSDRGIRPYRVADPLLWLLSEFGTVPRSKPGNGHETKA